MKMHVIIYLSVFAWMIKIIESSGFNFHTFQVYSWTAPSFEHSVDHVRAEDLISSRLLVEEHIPGQVSCSALESFLF